VVGGAAGNRLGAIRDAKGKPVAQVFTQLGGSAKAEVSRASAQMTVYSARFLQPPDVCMLQILKALAIKVLGSI